MTATVHPGYTVNSAPRITQQCIRDHSTVHPGCPLKRVKASEVSLSARSARRESESAPLRGAHTTRRRA
jgi:hypothetical protein